MTQTESPPFEQSRTRERIQDNLEQALQVETPKLKNYYTRRALQYCVIQDEVP